MNNQELDPESFPPLSPDGEKSAPNDPGFVATCLENLAALRLLHHVQVGAQALTMNDKWGVVFRADFILDHDTAPNPINRLVCWKNDKGKLVVTFAMWQGVKPLKA